MGFTRKMMSISTAGLVDFRSDKERTAAYTRQAKREAKKQTELMRQQTRLMQAQQRTAQRPAAGVPVPAVPQPTVPPQGQAAPPPPPGPPAGWYPDPSGAKTLRFWNGGMWEDRWGGPS